jgi:hypothetical protein
MIYDNIANLFFGKVFSSPRCTKKISIIIIDIRKIFSPILIRNTDELTPTSESTDGGNNAHIIFGIS